MRNLKTLLIVFSLISVTHGQYSSAVGNVDLAPNAVNVTLSPYLAHTNTGACTTTTGTDATSAIQNALTDVGNAGGGIVYVPAGVYCIRSHIHVPPFTALHGTFIAPPRANLTFGSATGGTVLLAVENAGNVSGTPFITMDGNSSTADGFTVYYPNQLPPSAGASSWTPTVYPPTIYTGAPDVTIQNIMLLNPYWGIKLSAQCGRHLVRNIYGEPLGQGISVDLSSDVGRISDIHFWPFWYGAGTTNQDTLVAEWIQTQAFSYVFQESDWEIVNNIFSYGYHVGALFSASSYGAFNGQMVNVNFDSTSVGLDIFQTQQFGVSIENLNVATHDGGTAIFVNPGSTAATVKINNATSGVLGIK